MAKEKHAADPPQDQESPASGLLSDKEEDQDWYSWLTTQAAATLSGYDIQHVRRLAHNPRNPLSLDAPLHDDGDLPHEWVNLLTPADDEPLRLDWLSDGILEGVLFKARHAAGYAHATRLRRYLNRIWDTIQTDRVLLRSRHPPCRQRAHQRQHRRIDGYYRRHDPEPPPTDPTTAGTPAPCRCLAGRVQPKGGQPTESL